MSASTSHTPTRSNGVFIHKVSIGPGTILTLFGALALVGTALAHAKQTWAPSVSQRSDAYDDPSRTDALNTSADAIKARIRTLQKLESQMQAATAQQIIGLYERLHGHALRSFGLTETEIEIALCTITGASNTETARKLHMTESAVKHRLSTIFKKTGTTSRHMLREKVLALLRNADVTA